MFGQKKPPKKNSQQQEAEYAAARESLIRQLKADYDEVARWPSVFDICCAILEGREPPPYKLPLSSCERCGVPATSKLCDDCVEYTKYEQSLAAIRARLHPKKYEPAKLGKYPFGMRQCERCGIYFKWSSLRAGYICDDCAEYLNESEDVH